MSCNKSFTRPPSSKAKFCSRKCVTGKFMSEEVRKKFSIAGAKADFSYRYTKESIENRLLKRITKTESCWIWNGHLNDKGYGSTSVVYERGKRLSKKVHRLFWEITHGEIPDGIEVCHSCDNRACVNPEHLFLGTHQDNMDDMVRKGRKTPKRGESNSFSKLTDEKVRRIRSMYPSLSSYKLAEMFGVSRTLINKIVKRILWPHVL